MNAFLNKNGILTSWSGTTYTYTEFLHDVIKSSHSEDGGSGAMPPTLRIPHGGTQGGSKNKYKRYPVWGEVDFKMQIIKMGEFEIIKYFESGIGLFGNSLSVKIGRGELKVKKIIHGEIHATWMYGHDELGNKWIDFYNKNGHKKIPIRPGVTCGDRKYYKKNDTIWDEISEPRKARQGIG